MLHWLRRHRLRPLYLKFFDLRINEIWNRFLYVQNICCGSGTGYVNSRHSKNWGPVKQQFCIHRIKRPIWWILKKSLFFLASHLNKSFYHRLCQIYYYSNFFLKLSRTYCTVLLPAGNTGQNLSGNTGQNLSQYPAGIIYLSTVSDIKIVCSVKFLQLAAIRERPKLGDFISRTRLGGLYVLQHCLKQFKQFNNFLLVLESLYNRGSRFWQFNI
jgi:hypothetical protein